MSLALLGAEIWAFLLLRHYEFAEFWMFVQDLDGKSGAKCLEICHMLEEVYSWTFTTLIWGVWLI